MSSGRQKGNNTSVKSPVEPCPKHTIDLLYLDCKDRGIAGAKYQVDSVDWDGKEDGYFSKSGTLDAEGKVHIDNVPEIKAFVYYFEKDPKNYKPEVVPSVQPDHLATKSIFDSIGNWLVGAAKGDFNHDQSAGQNALNAFLGLIPVVDQILDARDLAAGLDMIVEYYMEEEGSQSKRPDVLGFDYEKWIWINVFIIAIGCIPIVGSAVKGVLKGLIHYLKSVGKTAGKLSPRQLQAGWEYLVAILNKFGVGNAHKWLKHEFPAQLDDWMAKGSRTISDGLDRLKDAADAAVSGAKFFSPAQAAKIAERVSAYKTAITKAKSKVDVMANQVKAWLKEQVQVLTGGAHKSEKLGATGTKANKIEHTRQQRAVDPPELLPPLPPLRKKYVDEVHALRSKADQLKANGKSTEQIARELHAERRAIGERYKDLTPPDRLREIYARNTKRYGDPLGPSIEYLRGKGKSWDDIIDSACRPGGKDLGY
ncbi:MAG: hypothetical protein KF752_08145 [Pirellulaceae bacterium]|nr:hypothetical protein [Pirellulaceae bacterium]